MINFDKNCNKITNFIIVLLLFAEGIKSDGSINDSSEIIDEELDFNITHTDCIVQEWNSVTTETIPHSDLHDLWLSHNISYERKYLFHTSPSAISAFVYKDHISVVLSAENLLGTKVHCRYFDCKRRDIGQPFGVNVFPEMTVHCPRRSGAEYIAISEKHWGATEYPIPIIPRLEPQHYFSVCVAPLHGEEPKFLQIVDFIENWKLQGAEFFYFYVRNISDYDRILLDDYVRTGEVEVIKMHDHYWRDDFMWHHVQINDCLHRSKYFSKWTAVVDLDERIEMFNNPHKTVLELLDSTTDPNIINLHFTLRWVEKKEDTPARYTGEDQLRKDMIFKKFTNTSKRGSYFSQPKCIIRAEKIAAMSIHWPRAIYSGHKETIVNDSVGMIRHYRSVKPRSLPSDSIDKMYKHAPFKVTHLEPEFEKQLTENIVDRVKLVYDVEDVPCEKKQRTYWMHWLNATCWQEMNSNDTSSQ